MFYSCLLRKRDNSTHKIYSGRRFSADIGGFEGHFPPYPALWKVIIL